MCAQDAATLKSEIKVKRFLEAQNIPYEPGTDPGVLRGKAKARMKMIAEAGVDDNQKRALFRESSDNVFSVTQLKDMLSDIEKNKRSVEAHYTITMIVQDFNAVTQFTVLKHTIIKDGCKGKVINGQCKMCGDFIPRRRRIFFQGSDF